MEIATFTTITQSVRGSGANESSPTSFRTNIKTLGEIKSSQYYSVVATIIRFQRDKALYQACTETGPEGKRCNKKVQAQGNAKYRCEKCNLELHSFRWILNLRFLLADASGDQWVSCFQEMGEKILERSSQELGTLQQNQPETYNKVLDTVEFKKFNFRIKVTKDTYNDIERSQHTVQAVEEIDFHSYKKMMVKDLNENQIHVPPQTNNPKKLLLNDSHLN